MSVPFWSQTATITFDEFRDNIRRRVLAAIDAASQDTCGHVDAHGWADADLPGLFEAIDRHAGKLATKINDGSLPGSHRVRITM